MSHKRPLSSLHHVEHPQPTKRIRSNHYTEVPKPIPKSESIFGNPKPYEGHLYRQYTEKRLIRNQRKKKADYLFSVDDLNDIVQKAISLREEQIRNEYDSTLSNSLQDQFQQFQKCYADYFVAHPERFLFDFEYFR